MALRKSINSTPIVIRFRKTININNPDNKISAK